jgi:DNA modification methylase
MALPATAKREVPTQLWDISESISELAYLTHNFFRYYGKFPSVLGKRLIEQFALPNHVIVDNYAGSGTSLVEAKLAGFNSLGIDINPLGVLASKVKTRTYIYDGLVERWERLKSAVGEHDTFSTSAADDSRRGGSGDLYVKSSATSNGEKWFTEKARRDLAILKFCILQQPKDEYREFFALAFFAIIRRVSNAYDGEIRPHVNKDKRPRPVWKAYVKKVNEMIEREREWILSTDPSVWSEATIADNRTLSTLPILDGNPVGMIISHPPYLNSFDYLPAFSLEFQWADGFGELWRDHNFKRIRELEIRAWPATSQIIFDSYFENQRLMLAEAFKVLVRGGTCCVVIGDATIRKRLVPVHSMVADIAEDVGFQLEEIVYRTTHYGVGKYAYNHRADYHGDDNGKKDGVLILRKRL